MGWTISRHWLTLPEWEREEWRAYDLYQRRLAGILHKGMEKTETDDKGNTKHIVQDYATYFALWRESQ